MGLLIVFATISLVLIGFGTFIWEREAIWLLSNFPKDNAKVKDKKGLARWAGMFLYFIAILLFLVALILNKLIDTKYSMLPIVLFIPVVSLLVILFIVGGQRFLHKN